MQEDDPPATRGVASPFIPPPTPASSIAKRHIRFEKVSHLQYKCQWCHRAFPKSGDCYYHFLVAHSKRKRRRLGSRKPRCARCGFRSSSREDLHHHVRIRHEYSCQFCGENPREYFDRKAPKSGSGRLAVKRHEECRHLVKDYRCLLCGKRFYYLANLKAHVRGCHGGSQADLVG